MDDFDRDVHCLAGLPFDAMSIAGATGLVRSSIEQSTPCFVSTPNLNFLVASRTDGEFRESVIQSDMSLADGMPLVWMARLLSLPIRERVAGSSLFESLSERGPGSDRKLAVYFFGGMEGVAEQACKGLNADSIGMRCVGYESPGFGTVDDMSDDSAIERINASGADFLVVSLGAVKGQAWIMRNRARIAVPVISHLGAVINFVAGTVSRAPVWMQRAGLEWLWRVKEEPALWRRYWGDGMGFLGLVLKRLIPYAVWLKIQGNQSVMASKVVVGEADGKMCLHLSGAFDGDNLEELRSAFRHAAASGRDVNLDLEQATYLVPGFFGLLLMLSKHVRAAGNHLHVGPVPGNLKKVFYWSGVEYLLDVT